MSAGVEKEVRRARRSLIWWRLLGDVIGLPKMLLRVLAQWVANVESTVFIMEIDAARRYKALTGVDPGIATGDTDRYAGTDREYNEKVRLSKLAEVSDDEDDE